MKISFKELNQKPGIAAIISNINPSAKNSRLSSEADNSFKTHLNALGKSHQIRGFCITYFGNKTSENSAQQAFVDLAKYLCQSDEYYTKLKNKDWFYSKENISSIKNITKRYGNVRDDNYIFKDSEVTLLMAKAIRLVIDCNELELDNFSFVYDIRAIENTEETNWWPSAEEYDPGLTKEQWVEFFDNTQIMNPKRLQALAQMFFLGGRATMRELEAKFGESSDYYRNILNSISEKAVEYFEIEACNQQNAKTWPCMFVGKSVNKDRMGNYEWKMRDELKDALEEVNILQHLDDSEEAETVFRLPAAFSDQLSKRFVNSLLAKPFVILTGNSGTGKTRIATRFAKYLEVQFADGKNYELISVGADWTDNTSMLGYFNPLGHNGAGEYCETAILRLFIRAKENPEYPFFLILDEMNLSHVERYFSDFLSHMETPDTPFKIEHFSNNELTYPDNLFVIGTVNIDETTYMFSPKVLDRANVIEFKPDKNSVFALFDQQVFEETIDSADKNTARAFMSLVRKIKGNYSMDMSWAKDAFGQVYNILENNGFEFAYRTVKEICRYIYASKELLDSSFSIDVAVDEQIIQKLLPKIYGNKRSIGDMLEELIKVVETDYNFKLSAGKLRQMQRTLENTQYVSFI